MTFNFLQMMWEKYCKPKYCFSGLRVWVRPEFPKSDHWLRYCCLSVCLSVYASFIMEELSSLQTYFYKNSYLSIFRKCVEKIHFSFKSDKNNRYFT